ncbi:MAG: hypothetical protein PW844_23625 [Pantoea sp.]|uniref:hypothetical protein n=1 Tax=Pantoea sp. TaxID=69393 RepID=UPI002383733A|nr:hypothetical protein [Pantoea sp.]MDE1189418.1 hypothetical protein [Pantoea sp.]
MSIGRIYSAPILPDPVIRSDKDYSELSPSPFGFIPRVFYSACEERPVSFKYQVNSRVSLNELPAENKRWFGETVPPLSEPVVKPAPVKLTRGFVSPFSGKLNILNLRLNKFGSYSPVDVAAKSVQKNFVPEPKEVIQDAGCVSGLGQFVRTISKSNKYPDDKTLEAIVASLETGRNPSGNYRSWPFDSECRTVPEPVSEHLTPPTPEPERQTLPKPASEHLTSPKPEPEYQTLPKDIEETSSLSGSDSGCDILSDSEDPSRPPIPLEPVVIIKTVMDRKAENLQVKMDNFYNQFDESRTRENDRRRPNPSGFTLRAKMSNHYLCQNAKPPAIVRTILKNEVPTSKYEGFVIPFTHSDHLRMENDRNRKLSVRDSDDQFLEELKKEINDCARIFEESQAYHYSRYTKIREKIDGLNGVLEAIDEDSVLYLPPKVELKDYYYSLRDEIMLAIASEQKTILVDNAGRKINPLYVEDEPDY